MSMEEVQASAVVVVVSGDKANKVIEIPDLINIDALTLLEVAKSKGGYAVFTGPTWLIDGGVLGGWAKDNAGVMQLVSLIHSSLDNEVDDGYSQWLVLADKKLEKRVKKYLHKKYH